MRLKHALQFFALYCATVSGVQRENRTREVNFLASMEGRSYSCKNVTALSSQEDDPSVSGVDCISFSCSLNKAETAAFSNDVNKSLLALSPDCGSVMVQLIQGSCPFAYQIEMSKSAELKVEVCTNDLMTLCVSSPKANESECTCSDHLLMESINWLCKVPTSLRTKQSRPISTSRHVRKMGSSSNALETVSIQTESVEPQAFPLFLTVGLGVSFFILCVVLLTLFYQANLNPADQGMGSEISIVRDGNDVILLTPKPYRPEKNSFVCSCASSREYPGLGTAITEMHV